MARNNTTYSNKGGRRARHAHAKGKDIFSKYDTSAIDPNHRKSSLPGWALPAAAAVLVAIVAAAVLFSCSSSNPNAVPEGTNVSVTFEPGSSRKQIADKLYDAGLVNSANDFTAAVNRRAAAESLKPGTYTFVGGTSADELVDKIVAGPVVDASSGLVVPEGSTLQQTAQAVAQAYGGSITADDFIATATRAQDFVSEFPFVEGAYNDSLEGFLFPKTYEVVQGYTAADVVRQMLSQYRNETASLDYAVPEESNLDPYQTLILASIIEKEAPEQQMPQVASVFYNRLAQDMALQSDATSAYAIGGDPKPEDLQVDGPFNTYLNKGLPQGPICSPGVAALEAACHPASTDYLFFVFYPNDQGGVDYYFNQTYEGHQQAIAEHAPRD